MHGLITTLVYYGVLWAYYGCTNVSPEILNFLNNFVAPNMESVDLEN